MGAAVFAFLGTLIYGSLIAWGIHWILHRKWSGRFYRTHLNHHTKQYPPGNLLSEKYRSAGWEDGFFAFGPLATLAFVPFVGGLYWWGAPWWDIVGMLLEAALIGYGHDWLHEQFHLTRTRLLRFPWFVRLRAIHFAHHWHVQKNLGIVAFVWDRLFGTFREP